MEEYLRLVIKIASAKAPVIKPQIAYYAALGPDGLWMLIRLVEYAHELGLPVILDAKRADIGPTMAAYAEEVFGQYKVDACTFVPYLGGTFMSGKGTRSWLPYLAGGRCVISMVRTSNPEAKDFQDHNLGWGITNYESVAYMVKNWEERIFQETGVENAVGAVLGVPYKDEALVCRDIMGDKVFALCPGYGKQGGGADGAVAGLLTEEGYILGTVNSSRAITMDSWRAKDESTKAGDPLDSVDAAIEASTADLNSAITVALGHNPYE